jgi:putative SOS response-associated peptidase YedK
MSCIMSLSSSHFSIRKAQLWKERAVLDSSVSFLRIHGAHRSKQKRKDKWRFTLAGADWFCIAGIIRVDAVDGA